MEEIFFIQKYYYYLTTFICLLTLLLFSGYLSNKLPHRFIKMMATLFALFTVFYIGGRSSDIGTDTARYEQAFRLYESSQRFVIRKDVFYDLLSYGFARLLGFQELLIFCASIYIMGAFYSFKKIFKNDFYLPFIVFLISPYFFTSGINVMRSGVAASLFLVGLGVYYDKRKLTKTAFWFLGSVLFHVSMLVPLFFFVIARYLKNTKIIFVGWLFSIVLGILNINIIQAVIESLGIFESRVGDYAVNEGERNFWVNFGIFGVIPVVFAVFNVLFLKYRDGFYNWLLNGYMLTHIPYIILLNSQFALRLGYLAELMMPILIIFPLVINPKIELRFKNLKIMALLLVVFLIKAYKILII